MSGYGMLTSQGIGERIVVVGITGSGKTTLARQLGQRLNLLHTELDALHWEPNWTPAEMAMFQQRVTKVIKTDKWVIDGNYSKVRHLIWPRTGTLVWLDYSLFVIMWRLFGRALRRTARQELLWGAASFAAATRCLFGRSKGIGHAAVNILSFSTNRIMLI